MAHEEPARHHHQHLFEYRSLAQCIVVACAIRFAGAARFRVNGDGARSTPPSSSESQARSNILFHSRKPRDQPVSCWLCFDRTGSGRYSKRSPTDTFKYWQRLFTASMSTRVAVSWYSNVIVFRCRPVSRATSLILSFLSPMNRERWHLIKTTSNNFIQNDKKSPKATKIDI